ncbi:MAG: hypothetical protein AB3N63_17010 [Puniceicoccaceae bacterium]
MRSFKIFIVAQIAVVSSLLGQTDFSQYLGLFIFAQNPDQTFLGVITDYELDENSIINAFGTHGSTSSQSSIRNASSLFGGTTGEFSAYNSSASTPPLIYSYDEATGYTAVAFLTKNTVANPQVDPDELIEFLQNYDATGANGGIKFVGSSEFEFTGDSVALEVESISNFNPQGSTSGSLQIELWAGLQPFTGTEFTGWQVATASLGTIGGGLATTTITGTVSIKNLPPLGVYYMTMFLTEWNGSNYASIDYIRFTEIWTPPASLLWRKHTLQDGWLEGWIGRIQETSHPKWIYRTETGWMFAQYNTPDSGYFYLPDLGWAWMSEASSPYFNLLADGNWYFFLN